MPNKEEATYKKIVLFIKNKIPNLQIDNLIVDFTQATVNAFLHIYPECKIRYYVFHFLRQSIKIVSRRTLANLST